MDEYEIDDHMSFDHVFQEKEIIISHMHCLEMSIYMFIVYAQKRLE